MGEGAGPRRRRRQAEHLSFPFILCPWDGDRPFSFLGGGGQGMIFKLNSLEPVRDSVCGVSAAHPSPGGELSARVQAK